ncbi:MAG TPA: NAD(P)H-binding protein [Solirubrobacteraceae bacterium]|nr:NAD(P)H-binding protein [Solirubrobacteraceae bacterium]
MRLLVTGVSGYVGSLLATRLLADGHEVRGFARSPARVRVPGLEVRAGDAVTGAGLTEAMDGIEVAYFLIHAMEAVAAGADPFPAREAEAARRFADAAARAGVRRIVYLGGPVPPGTPSPHLESRLAVERALLAAVPGSVALRASIVIGARSRSFALLVRLIERLPVLALPAWRDNRTAPIDERDVLRMLVAAADARLPSPAARTRIASVPGARTPPSAAGAGHTLDAAGPEIVTYGELLHRIAELMLVDRAAVPLGPLSLTPVASVLAAALADEDPALVRPLMESLETDLLPNGDSAAEALSVRLHPLDAAIEHALGDWERSQPLAAR